MHRKNAKKPEPENPVAVLDEDIKSLQEDIKILRKEKDKLQQDIRQQSQSLVLDLKKDSKQSIEQATSLLKQSLYEFLKVSPIYEHKYVYGGVMSEDFKSALQAGWHIVAFDFDKKQNQYVHVMQRPAQFDEVKFSAKISEFFKDFGIGNTDAKPKSKRTVKKAKKAQQ